MRWRPALVLGMLWLASGPASGAEPPEVGPDPGGHLHFAREASRTRRFPEALAQVRRADAAAPTSRAALLGHGAVAEFMGEFAEARGAYDRAVAREPHHLPALYASALLAFRVGEYDRAIAFLDRLIAAHPAWVRVTFAYAPARFQTGLFRGYPPVAWAAEAGPAWLGGIVRGLFLERGLLGEYPFLRHLVEIRIDMLMEKGDLEGARRMAWGYGIVESGRNYCEDGRRYTGDSDATFRWFRLAALAQPEQADCIWWYGQWLTDEGFVRLGRLMVLEGTRVTPVQGNKASGARYVRIRLSGGQDIAKRAEQLSRIGRQRHDRDGDPAGAARLLEEAIRLEPSFVRPYDHLARIAWEGGDHEGAVATLRRGVEADPDSWRTHRNLAKAFDGLGRHAEAERHFRRTVELFDDDLGGRLGLARALYALGRFGEYAVETERALKLGQAWGTPLGDVRVFLEEFRTRGPGKELPPDPDPRMFIGWNRD
jgi:tetratricopeptide (TPR) repeat protein